MSLNEKFDEAVKAVSNLKTKQADADLLEIYGLYKQASVGDVNTARPGITDFKGKAKWDAWNSKKGLAQDAAKEQYVAKATSLGAL